MLGGAGETFGAGIDPLMDSDQYQGLTTSELQSQQQDILQGKPNNFKNPPTVLGTLSG